MQEMRNIDDELVRLESDFEDSGMTVSNLLKLAANVDELFKSSKPAVKNRILRLVVSNLNIQQKRLNFNLLEPFAELIEINSRIAWCPKWDSDPQGFLHSILSRTRIPIPPFGHIV